MESEDLAMLLLHNQTLPCYLTLLLHPLVSSSISYHKQPCVNLLPEREKSFKSSTNLPTH